MSKYQTIKMSSNCTISAIFAKICKIWQNVGKCQSTSASVDQTSEKIDNFGDIF